jgi:hypothetical protein
MVKSRVFSQSMILSTLSKLTRTGNNVSIMLINMSVTAARIRVVDLVAERMKLKLRWGTYSSKKCERLYIHKKYY